MNQDAAAEAFRQQLVDDLVAAGTVVTERVEHALRTVPRERFLTDTDPARVYEDRAQLVKRDARTTLSTISQPTMVAIMLELARLEPGHRVLEIGTGTGYNAALLGTIVGPEGRVVSVDVEPDLVAHAADALDDLELTQVEVHVADGRHGWPDGAPYDVVMATASVRRSVPDEWRAQVADGGRLLVPVDAERQLRVERRDGARWVLESSSGAAFIPLR